MIRRTQTQTIPTAPRTLLLLRPQALPIRSLRRYPPNQSYRTQQSACFTRLPLGAAHPLFNRHVPPGQGKLATQRRNLRRRTKKFYDRLGPQEQADPSNPNDIPLNGPPALRRSKEHAAAASSSTTNVPIMMASLSNKNKRRGFKQAMSSERPAKIIFSQPNLEDAASSAVQPLPFQSTSDSAAFASTPARLIPPSEKQEAGLLPSNVFVTSIDVEDPERFAVHDSTDVLQIHEPLGQNSTLASATRESQNTVDFLDVERKWETLQAVTDILQIQLGSMVAWKVRAVYRRL